MRPGTASTMNADRAEAAFWAAFLRNRNVDAGTSADGAVPVAGGFGLCLLGTFLEYGIGIGSTRPLRPDDLAVLGEFYARRGLAARLELDETVLARDRAVLAAGGYAEDGPRIAALEAAAGAGAAFAPVEGVVVRPAGDRRAWTELVVRGFADTVAEDRQARLRRTLQAAAAAAQGLFVASVGGTDAGAGAVGISGDVAYLFGAAVLPAYRGHGVHRALVGARMAFGLTRGASRAALKTEPGSSAARSALRLGFELTALRRRVRAAA